MNQNNIQIINNLRKEITDIKVYARENYKGYKRKELEFRYSIPNSQLERRIKEGKSYGNAFWYYAGEKEIDELAKKNPMELFDFLAPKHLEKNVGYGEFINREPKRFKTPCPLCNQKSLTTLGWSEEGYPDNLEGFYCRLCRLSFGYLIELKDDPIELQREMTKYYIVFAEKEIKKKEKELDEINERLVNIHEFLIEKKQLLDKLRRI